MDMDDAAEYVVLNSLMQKKEGFKYKIYRKWLKHYADEANVTVEVLLDAVCSKMKSITKKTNIEVI